jgi:hypoxanthine-guanine phosphoribosyltransferase
MPGPRLQRWTTSAVGSNSARLEAGTYVGFDIPNEFVVGYGLDYAGRYRNLSGLGTLAPHVYS